MKQHEREYFVTRIRAGFCLVRERGLNLKILTPSIQQSYESSEVFNDAYNKAYADGIMDEEDMHLWMIEHGLWSDDDDERIKGLEKDIENMKVEIYNARNYEEKRERIRLIIRAGEDQLHEMRMKKAAYNTNTCEGIASLEKWKWIIENCTLMNGKPYNFEELSIDYVLHAYQSTFISEKKIRELARTDPWKSTWTITEKCEDTLFRNEGRELGVDQKNMVIWSIMYDNIHESLECPRDDVLEDADMLDGWLITQRKKNEKDKAEAEFEGSTSNEKIKNSDEIFVMAGNDKDKERVEGLNDLAGTMVMKQREAVLIKNLKEGNATEQHEFIDEKLRMRRRSNEQYKGKFRR